MPRTKSERAEMWDKFLAIRHCAPFRTLAEAEEMFPNFEPL